MKYSDLINLYIYHRTMANDYLFHSDDVDWFEKSLQHEIIANAIEKMLENF